ncbi:MAG: hypothetical protein HUJ51_02415 [Eggerthellaceae bacterium]|nr:hypothetical protein [Eggerthellaceae bacterium]
MVVSMLANSTTLRRPIAKAVILVVGALVDSAAVDKFKRRSLLIICRIVMTCSVINPSIIKTLLMAGGITGQEGYIAIACVSLYVDFH